MSRISNIFKRLGVEDKNEGKEAVRALQWFFANSKFTQDDYDLMYDMAKGKRSLSSAETKKAMSILDDFKKHTTYTLDGFGLNDVAAALEASKLV
jgi:hypothetical protein